MTTLSALQLSATGRATKIPSPTQSVSRSFFIVHRHFTISRLTTLNSLSSTITHATPLATTFSKLDLEGGQENPDTFELNEEDDKIDDDPYGLKRLSQPLKLRSREQTVLFNLHSFAVAERSSPLGIEQIPLFKPAEDEIPNPDGERPHGWPLAMEQALCTSFNTDDDYEDDGKGGKQRKPKDLSKLRLDTPLDENDTFSMELRYLMEKQRNCLIWSQRSKAELDYYDKKLLLEEEEMKGDSIYAINQWVPPLVREYFEMVVFEGRCNINTFLTLHNNRQNNFEDEYNEYFNKLDYFGRLIQGKQIEETLDKMGMNHPVECQLEDNICPIPYKNTADVLKALIAGKTTREQLEMEGIPVLASLTPEGEKIIHNMYEKAVKDMKHKVMVALAMVSCIYLIILFAIV